MEKRYEIFEKIGQGGCGRVHRGYDHRMHREVAIKRIIPSIKDPTLEGEASKQLLVEVEALASLQHPYIITVFDVGQDEEGPYVVMELIKGMGLDEVVRNGPMIWQDFKQVAVQSLEALIAAQERNMVHSDLKPANIMLTWLPSGNFQIKIVDFGLAMMIHNQNKEETMRIDSVFGSIFFMPPEQFERQTLDARSDLYSIGCVYYHALTGTYPFKGETGLEAMEAHINHDVIPIQELRKDIPEWACEWVMWLINRDRNHRPESAYEALSNFQQNEINSIELMIQGGEEPEYQDPATTDQTPPEVAGLEAAMTITGSQASRSTADQHGMPASGLSKSRIRMIGIAVASMALIAMISLFVVMLMKRNERVRRGWAYDNLMVMAAQENVAEIPADTEAIQIVLEKIAGSPGNAVITTPLRALALAKTSDGTDIDAIIAKFATEAEMNEDIRQKLFKEVIEVRRSASAIPFMAAYQKKTGKGGDTLSRLQLLNGIRPAPSKLPEPVSAAKPEAPAPTAKKETPKPQPTPNQQNPTQTLNNIGMMRAALKGNDETQKIDAIAALGRSDDKSANAILLGHVKDERDQRFRSLIIAAYISRNSQPSQLKDEEQSKQSWLELSRQSKSDEEKQAVVQALKDIKNDWATDLLGEYAKNTKTPKAASLAKEILEGRKP